jgi:hypothetical protein
MAAPLFVRVTAALGVAALLIGTATPVSAAPVPSSVAALKAATASDVVDVRYRGRGGAGIAAGIATGLILGGIIASQPRYYGYGPGYYGYGPRYYGYYYGGPQPLFYGPRVFYPPGHYGPIVGPGYGGGDWMSYCFSRYRSFDPATGTYMGYDGRRHPCR